MKIRPFLIVCALLLISPVIWAQQVTLGPDSQIKADVPHGTTTHYTFKNSQIYPGTERDYWVYVPKQYDGKTPACVMVFQDGGGYQDVNGSNRVPVVFDNLIAKGEMPVTVGVMVNPGVVPASRPDALPRFNRSVEYDTPDDTYARFLLTELLPEVGKTIKLTDDPNCRGLCGGSSGGMASFVAAWFRPDAFRRVISGIGSFVDLRGGNVLPDRIRKHEPKPLRVYLQDNENDQDIYGGSWPIANRDMAAALKFAGYDYQFVTDPGGHDGRQLGARLPDALRWLWRDYPKPITPRYTTNQPVTALIEPGESWQRLTGNYIAVALGVNGAGELFILSPFDSFDNEGVLYRVDANGIASLTAIGRDQFSAFAFGPNEKLYLSAHRPDRLVVYDLTQNRPKPVDVAEIAIRSHIVVSSAGVLYADSDKGLTWINLHRPGTILTLRDNIFFRGICLSPDQSLLIVSSNSTRVPTNSYQLAADGNIEKCQPYFDLQTGYGKYFTEVYTCITDRDGWTYFCTEMGIQVCDQAGRVNAVLDGPNGETTGQIAFGGKNRDVLYAISSGVVYRRKMRAKGVLPFEPPIKPAPPRL